MSAGRSARRRLAAALVASSLLGTFMSASALAAAPDNDDSATPRVVGALPYADGPYDTTEATTAASDPGFCHEPTIGPDRATVWYAFTPGASDRYLADTFGSDYDTTLYVGTSNGAGGIDVIGCIDDSQGLQSAVAWDAEAGTTYLIVVGTCCGPGAAGGGGSLQFHVAVAPPPPTLDITIDATGSFTPYGTATLRGTIACTNANPPAGLNLAVSQRVGRITIRGFGFADVECSAAPAPWSLAVAGDDGKLLGGHATVDVAVFVCGPIECADDFEHAVVRLRH
jgi:hypothetical protein